MGGLFIHSLKEKRAGKTGPLLRRGKSRHMANHHGTEKKMAKQKIIFFSQIFFSRSFKMLGPTEPASGEKHRRGEQRPGLGHGLAGRVGWPPDRRSPPCAAQAAAGRPTGGSPRGGHGGAGVVDGDDVCAFFNGAANDPGVPSAEMSGMIVHPAVSTWGPSCCFTSVLAWAVSFASASSSSKSFSNPRFSNPRSRMIHFGSASRTLKW